MNSYVDVLKVLNKDCKRNCDSCYSSCNSNDCGIRPTALAVEKMIPKVPKLNKDGCDLYYEWSCPSCDSCHEIDDEHNHCPDCGQKIDWIHAYDENEEENKQENKQVPMKPKVHKATNKFLCPNCRSQMILFEDIAFDYCPDCGQSIDWSEYE